jgi:hypothetical protein
MIKVASVFAQVLSLINRREFSSCRFSDLFYDIFWLEDSFNEFLFYSKPCLGENQVRGMVFLEHKKNCRHQLLHSPGDPESDPMMFYLSHLYKLYKYYSLFR